MFEYCALWLVDVVDFDVTVPVSVATVVGGWWQVAVGCGMFVITCLLLVICSWVLVVDGWLWVVGGLVLIV